MWFEERARKDRVTDPKFSQCCMQGKVQLPKLQEPPQTLQNLYKTKGAKSRSFLDNIRAFNMMFAFTSMGGKIDSSVNRGRGPSTFRLHGQNYHRIGSLLPPTGSSPKFSHSSNTKNSLDGAIVEDLRHMLDEHNPLAKAFRGARDRFESNNHHGSVKLKLIGRRESDGRTYNLPTASEVAALIVGYIGSSTEERDIILETQSGQLQRITELHPSYLALQYPLLFPYGEDRYRLGIQLRDTSKRQKRKKLTMREFLAYRIHERRDEAKTLLWARKLLQQFLVDGLTMIESERLCYVRTHQKNLRADNYKNVTKARMGENTNSFSTGKRIVLPSSFTGGARYMVQNYQDAMAICKWYGYPDLFITFTCHPKWPEIMRYVQQRGLKPEDRPDILCRIFKIKLDQLTRDLKDGKIFGGVQSVIYTVEFQKRGLPHAHILLFLNQEQAPCMKDGKCSKHYPKKFNERTTIGDDGYANYRRRNNGRTVEKNGVTLDNRYVVPYNPYLLMKYGAHINVEWYISPCEAVWRILGYDIHYRTPSVQRLSFHLPNEQSIVFEDDEPLDNIINKPGIDQTMFLGWMELNKTDPIARQLTYAEIPTKFVWNKDGSREWSTRKQRLSIGRVYYVPPGSGELYYLSALLNTIQGATCYKDIRIVNGVLYSSFKEACYARGLLDDDKEYIDVCLDPNLYRSKYGNSLETIFFIGKNVSSKYLKEVYEEIMGALAEDKGGVFFLYGYGGTGKTFMWKTLSAAIRCQGEIVLNVASSGIASLLLPEGRTAHSRFAIPINVNEDTTCDIKQIAPLAELLIRTKLIIWDEAPMVNKFCFEALDRSLRDIHRFSNPNSMEQPFGGKVVVFGGDFRQILPVVPKGSRQDIVFAAINSSYLWNFCRVLSLTRNMRLQVGSSEDSNEIREFSEWILRIGDGKEGEPNDGETTIEIPDDVLIRDVATNPVAAIVDSIYPSVLENLDDPKFFQDRAILAPTNECVEEVNEHLLSMISGEHDIRRTENIPKFI
ncbi:uncharacterized protein [Spinacia oleracea]|uniref:ATP-dependent DNA helicase n=1 Tax=Spinacia oleracea TaxID=3562 RepID=A0ABM3R0P6_SPIOL|nr:uncharacterized protein LOC110774775 [Spinacia oleracea]